MMDHLDIPVALKRLIERLTLHKNVRWEVPDYDAGADDGRVETVDLDEAEAASSRVRYSDVAREIYPDLADQHVVLLDVDVPAWLVPSSTPGHSHLYANVTCGWADYCEFLDAAVKIGLLEPGYVNACKARGVTSLRLPWVKKPSHQESASS